MEIDKFEYIVINKGSKSRCVSLSSKHAFFKNDMTFKVIDNKIIFYICDSTWSGPYITPYKRNSGWVGFSIFSDIPVGKFYFEKEESNEDIVTVYFE